MIDAAILRRILGAAHAAPSVGLSQPWGFVIVRDHAVRTRIRESFLRARELEAARYEPDRRAAYLVHHCARDGSASPYARRVGPQDDSEGRGSLLLAGVAASRRNVLSLHGSELAIGSSRRFSAENCSPYSPLRSNSRLLFVFGSIS